MESQRKTEAPGEVDVAQASSRISGDNNMIFSNSHVTVNNYLLEDSEKFPQVSGTEEMRAGTGEPRDETHSISGPGNISAQIHTQLALTTAAVSDHTTRWQEKVHSLVTTENKMFVPNNAGKDLYYSRESRIAAGSDGTHVFVGIFGSKPVAIKKCVYDSVKEKDKVVARSLLAKPLAHVLIPEMITEDDNFVYYMSKLCEWNLKEVTEEPTNPLRLTLNHWEWQRIGLEFLRGLKELHDLSILHRDLKPSNVLLDRAGRVFVADFGVSRLLTDKTSTVTVAIGTMCWMAKEILEAVGPDVRYEFSADIQVAGYLLYYILTEGHIPHEATFPYKNDMHAVSENIRRNKHSLEHLTDQTSRNLVEEMINPVPQLRPRVSECLSHFQSTVTRVLSAHEPPLKTNSSRSIPHHPENKQEPSKYKSLGVQLRDEARLPSPRDGDNDQSSDSDQAARRIQAKFLTMVSQVASAERREPPSQQPAPVMEPPKSPQQQPGRNEQKSNIVKIQDPTSGKDLTDSIMRARPTATINSHGVRGGSIGTPLQSSDSDQASRRIQAEFLTMVSQVANEEKGEPPSQQPAPVTEPPKSPQPQPGRHERKKNIVKIQDPTSGKDLTDSIMEATVNSHGVRRCSIGTSLQFSDSDQASKRIQAEFLTMVSQVANEEKGEPPSQQPAPVTEPPKSPQPQPGSIERKRNIVKIQDPTSGKDLTDSIMRARPTASSTATVNSHRVSRGSIGTSLQFSDSDQASRRIQAEFLTMVSQVANEEKGEPPSQQPAPVTEPPKSPQPQPGRNERKRGIVKIQDPTSGKDLTDSIMRARPTAASTATVNSHRVSRGSIGTSLQSSDSDQASRRIQAEFLTMVSQVANKERGEPPSQQLAPVTEPPQSPQPQPGRNERKRNIVKIQDPTSGKDLTDSIMRARPTATINSHGVRGGSIGTPLQSSDSDQASKRIQAEFLTMVSQVANKEKGEPPSQQPAPVTERPKSPQPQPGRNERKRNIVKIQDPTSGKDLTDSIMRARPTAASTVTVNSYRVRGGSIGTPLQSSDSDQASKRTQAEFLTMVSQVANEEKGEPPSQQPAPVTEPPQSPQPQPGRNEQKRNIVKIQDPTSGKDLTDSIMSARLTEASTVTVNSHRVRGGSIGTPLQGVEFTERAPSTMKLATKRPRQSTPSMTPKEVARIGNFQRDLILLFQRVHLETDAVFDFIESTIPPPMRNTKEFIHALVFAVCFGAVRGEGTNSRVDHELLKKRSVLMQKYIDGNPQLELQALFAVEALSYSLENPPGLLRLCFDVLYDEDVISEEIFFAWRDGTEPTEKTGGGIALESVSSFFTWLEE